MPPCVLNTYSECRGLILGNKPDNKLMMKPPQLAYCTGSCFLWHILCRSWAKQWKLVNLVNVALMFDNMKSTVWLLGHILMVTHSERKRKWYQQLMLSDTTGGSPLPPQFCFINRVGTATAYAWWILFSVYVETLGRISRGHTYAKVISKGKLLEFLASHTAPASVFCILFSGE